MNPRLKRVILRTLGPLDRLDLIINGKRDVPPLHLRWDVGPLYGFESSGAEFRVYLKLFGGMKEGTRMLDIGCGCGQTALAIRNDLGSNGEYVGCDISGPSISWCTRRIARHDRRFTFYHMDIHNGRYNPHGTISARGFHFPQDWGTFDLILLKSVFTHMRRDEVTNYLNQLRALLRQDGKCLATFFLVNDKTRALHHAGKAEIPFLPGGDGASYADPDLPESIVAYEDNDVRNMIRKAGLHLSQPVRYGTWSGQADGLSHQDILLLSRSRGK
jgi:SAM-dependent methyltransferase